MTTGPTITRDELAALLAEVSGTTKIVGALGAEDGALVNVTLDAADVADAIEQGGAPAFDLTENGEPITCDELLAALADAPGDAYLLAYDTAIEDYLNVSLAAETVAEALRQRTPIPLSLRDDFDTRQW